MNNRVFIIDTNKQPLKPTTPKRARELLNKGKAAIFRRYPFTEPYALDSETFVALWEKGYKVIPLTLWGAAESIYIEPGTQRKVGVQDPRKPSGKAATP